MRTSSSATSTRRTQLLDLGLDVCWVASPKCLATFKAFSARFASFQPTASSTRFSSALQSAIALTTRRPWSAAGNRTNHGLVAPCYRGRVFRVGVQGKVFTSMPAVLAECNSLHRCRL